MMTLKAVALLLITSCADRCLPGRHMAEHDCQQLTSVICTHTKTMSICTPLTTKACSYQCDADEVSR